MGAPIWTELNHYMPASKLSSLLAFIKQPRWLLIISGILIMGVIIGIRATTSSSEDAHGGFKKNKAGGSKFENQTPTVAVAISQLADMPVYLNGLGTVTALHTVTVRSRVDGELVKVNFTEGQYVKQGEVLAQIDPRPYQVQLQQAQGQLMRDEALLKNAQIDLSRYQTLLDQDSIAPQQTATQSALVKQYQGTVEIDRALVENAKLQLSYAHITAPVAGRIGLRLVDQGNMIRSSDTNGMAVITQLQPISVVFTLPEDVVPSIMQRWHDQPNFSVDAFDRSGNHQLASGQLLAVDNQIDANTGTIKLKAQFDNQERKLFSNQFVNIRMKLDTLRNVVTVPTAAIQQGANGAFVYVVNADQTVTVKPVKTGPSENGAIVITQGLNPSEQVVTDGADKLREGITVNLPATAAAQPEEQTDKTDAQARRGRRKP